MEIKDQSTETATDAQGREYIAESHQTVTDTSADGTISVAEMTATANPDDPTEIEGQMTITATAPDGTETVTEFVANDEGVFQVEENSFLEQAAENIFGIEIEDNLTKVMDADGNPVNENADGEEVYAAETDSDADDAEFDSNDDGFAQSGEVFEPQSANFVSNSTVQEPAFDTFAPESATYDAGFNSIETYSATAENDVGENDLSAEENQQIAHTNAATDAQAQADEFIAKGDYAAAADARETAENESWEAGDDSMLGAYDAQDLTNATEKQEDANYYEAQQAEHAQAGDYEAAREDANNAAYATYDADSTAGGDDHTGQADAEKYEMDWAVSEEKQADYNAQSADAYAADGDFENAEMYAAEAADHQSAADNYGNLGEHGGEMAVYDTSSVVDTGGISDSSYDSHLADTTVDTSYDSGADDV